MNSKAFVTEKYAVIERREPVKEKNLKWKRGMPKIRKMFEKEGETEEKAEKEKYMCRKLEGNNLRSWDSSRERKWEKIKSIGATERTQWKKKMHSQGESREYENQVNICAEKQVGEEKIGEVENVHVKIRQNCGNENPESTRTRVQLRNSWDILRIWRCRGWLDSWLSGSFMPDAFMVSGSCPLERHACEKQAG